MYEDGEPDQPGGGTRLIAFFEVPDGGDGRLREGWERVRALLAARQGYLGARLYRSDEADFRFVALVGWSSPLMYARALQQPEIADAAAALPFPFQSALYLAVSA